MQDHDPVTVFLLHQLGERLRCGGMRAWGSIDKAESECRYTTPGKPEWWQSWFESMRQAVHDAKAAETAAVCKMPEDA